MDEGHQRSRSSSLEEDSVNEVSLGGHGHGQRPDNDANESIESEIGASQPQEVQHQPQQQQREENGDCQDATTKPINQTTNDNGEREGLVAGTSTGPSAGSGPRVPQVSKTRSPFKASHYSNRGCKSRPATPPFVHLVPDISATMSIVSSQGPAVRAEEEMLDMTTVVLRVCKERVLRPYDRLIALVGWKSFCVHHRDTGGLVSSKSCIASVAGHLYTGLILGLLLIGFVLQQAACYRQDRLITFCEWDSSPGDHFVSDHLLPDLLILAVYLHGLCSTRAAGSRERLEELMERAFLATVRLTSWLKAQRRVIRVLRLHIALALIWSVAAGGLHALRLSLPPTFSHHGDLFRYNGHVHHDHHYGNRTDSIQYSWLSDLLAVYFNHDNDRDRNVLITTHDVVQDLLTGALLLGSIVGEVVIATAAATYSVQCRLIASYLINLTDMMRERRITFTEFYKRAEESRKFISSLNWDHALGVSLLLILALGRATVALVEVFTASRQQHQRPDVFSTPQELCLLLLSTTLWLLIGFFVLLQAARVSEAAAALSHLGHELAARPFGYEEAATTRSELDSLLAFTSTLRLEARLCFVPIKSSRILLTSGLLALCLLLVAGQLGSTAF